MSNDIETTVVPEAPTVPAVGVTEPAERALTSRDQTVRPKSDNTKAGLIRGPSPKEPRNAPLYRVTKKPHFLNGRIYQPGDSVHYAGIPGVLLEPLDYAAKVARAAADQARAEREAEREALKINRNKVIKLLKAL